MATGSETAGRARRWRNAMQAAVCDVHEPWAHGTVLRATRYPDYFDLNLVRVEDDPGISVDALVAAADRLLAGLAHRRFEFDHPDAVKPLRAEFEARGWRTESLTWMRHESAPPPGPELRVEEVPYDAVRDLRRAWHDEDFPGLDPGDYELQAREVDLARGAQVLAVSEAGEAVAFAQLERGQEAAEITQVYVAPPYRGAGRGTAMTRAAIEAAGEVGDLWIVADSEGRAKDLYARLGFRPAWTAVEMLRAF